MISTQYMPPSQNQLLSSVRWIASDRINYLSVGRIEEQRNRGGQVNFNVSEETESKPWSYLRVNGSHDDDHVLYYGEPCKYVQIDRAGLWAQLFLIQRRSPGHHHGIQPRFRIYKVIVLLKEYSGLHMNLPENVLKLLNWKACIDVVQILMQRLHSNNIGLNWVSRMQPSNWNPKCYVPNCKRPLKQN